MYRLQPPVDATVTHSYHISSPVDLLSKRYRSEMLNYEYDDHNADGDDDDTDDAVEDSFDDDDGIVVVAVGG